MQRILALMTCVTSAVSQSSSCLTDIIPDLLVDIPGVNETELCETTIELRRNGVSASDHITASFKMNNATLSKTFPLEDLHYRVSKTVMHPTMRHYGKHSMGVSIVHLEINADILPPSSTLPHVSPTGTLGTLEIVKVRQRYPPFPTAPAPEADFFITWRGYDLTFSGVPHDVGVLKMKAGAGDATWGVRRIKNHETVTSVSAANPEFIPVRTAIGPNDDVHTVGHEDDWGSFRPEAAVVCSRPSEETHGEFRLCLYVAMCIDETGRDLFVKLRGTSKTDVDQGFADIGCKGGQTPGITIHPGIFGKVENAVWDTNVQFATSEKVSDWATKGVGLSGALGGQNVRSVAHTSLPHVFVPFNVRAQAHQMPMWFDKPTASIDALSTLTPPSVLSSTGQPYIKGDYTPADLEAKGATPSQFQVVEDGLEQNAAFRTDIDPQSMRMIDGTTLQVFPSLQGGSSSSCHLRLDLTKGKTDIFLLDIPSLPSASVLYPPPGLPDETPEPFPFHVSYVAVRDAEFQLVIPQIEGFYKLTPAEMDTFSHPVVFRARMRGVSVEVQVPGRVLTFNTANAEDLGDKVDDWLVIRDSLYETYNKNGDTAGTSSQLGMQAQSANLRQGRRLNLPKYFRGEYCDWSGDFTTAETAAGAVGATGDFVVCLRTAVACMNEEYRSQVMIPHGCGCDAEGMPDGVRTNETSRERPQSNLGVGELWVVVMDRETEVDVWSGRMHSASLGDAGEHQAMCKSTETAVTVWSTGTYLRPTTWRVETSKSTAALKNVPVLTSNLCMNKNKITVTQSFLALGGVKVQRFGNAGAEYYMIMQVSLYSCPFEASAGTRAPVEVVQVETLEIVPIDGQTDPLELAGSDFKVTPDSACALPIRTVRDMLTQVDSGSMYLICTIYNVGPRKLTVSLYVGENQHVPLRPGFGSLYVTVSVVDRNNRIYHKDVPLFDTTETRRSLETPMPSKVEVLAALDQTVRRSVSLAPMLTGDSPIPPAPLQGKSAVSVASRLSWGGPYILYGTMVTDYHILSASNSPLVEPMTETVFHFHNFEAVPFDYKSTTGMVRPATVSDLGRVKVAKITSTIHTKKNQLLGTLTFLDAMVQPAPDLCTTANATACETYYRVSNDFSSSNGGRETTFLLGTPRRIHEAPWIDGRRPQDVSEVLPGRYMCAMVDATRQVESCLVVENVCRHGIREYTESVDPLRAAVDFSAWPCHALTYELHYKVRVRGRVEESRSRLVSILGPSTSPQSTALYSQVIGVPGVNTRTTPEDVIGHLVGEENVDVPFATLSHNPAFKWMERDMVGMSVATWLSSAPSQLPMFKRNYFASGNYFDVPDAMGQLSFPAYTRTVRLTGDARYQVGEQWAWCRLSAHVADRSLCKFLPTAEDKHATAYTAKWWKLG